MRSVECVVGKEADVVSARWLKPSCPKQECSMRKAVHSSKGADAGRRCSFQSPEAKQSFTLIELSVVIAILGILGSLLLPVLGKAKVRATGSKCLNNLKQLQTCWQMYVDDHEDRVPPNRSMQTNGIWRSTPDSWIGESSALYDTDPRAIENGILFKYDYNRSLKSYHCPGDESKVRTPKGRELGILRTRSYSMSGCLGGNYDTNKEPTTIQRANEIQAPSQLFVFIDEHEDSIDDAHFLVWSSPDDRWVNLPADRHGQVGCSRSPTGTWSGGICGPRSDQEPAPGQLGRIGRQETLGDDWRTSNALGLRGPKAGEDARAPQKTVMRQDDARNDHDVMSILDPHQTPLVNHPCVRRVPGLWKELFIR